jgi:hypothetical protein
MGEYKRKQSNKNNQNQNNKATTTKPKQTKTTKHKDDAQTRTERTRAGGGYLARSARRNASSTASNLGRRQQLLPNTIEHLRAKAGFRLPVTKEESPTLRAALAGVREGEWSLEAEGLSGDRAMLGVKRLRETSDGKQGDSRLLVRGCERRMGGGYG